MQCSDITGKFALLTRQELAYLSGGLPELTTTQKSKINYKIKKKLEIFEKVELPLLLGRDSNPGLFHNL
jgi:ribosomal protein L5